MNAASNQFFAMPRLPEKFDEIPFDALLLWVQVLNQNNAYSKLNPTQLSNLLARLGAEKGRLDSTLLDLEDAVVRVTELLEA